MGLKSNVLTGLIGISILGTSGCYVDENNWFLEPPPGSKADLERKQNSDQTGLVGLGLGMMGQAQGNAGAAWVGDVMMKDAAARASRSQTNVNINVNQPYDNQQANHPRSLLPPDDPDRLPLNQRLSQNRQNNQMPPTPIFQYTGLRKDYDEILKAGFDTNRNGVFENKDFINPRDVVSAKEDFVSGYLWLNARGQQVVTRVYDQNRKVVLESSSMLDQNTGFLGIQFGPTIGNVLKPNTYILEQYLGNNTSPSSKLMFIVRE